MKKILTICISIIISFVSCTKDNTNSTIQETTIQKLQHKWNLISIKDIQYVGSSTIQIDTIIDYGVPGDYIDFSINNLAYMRIAGSKDTVAYSLINNNKIILDADTFTVNNLTSSNLQMTYYGREKNPVNNWDNVIILSR
jgi:hypothetical protein